MLFYIMFTSSKSVKCFKRASAKCKLMLSSSSSSKCFVEHAETHLFAGKLAGRQFVSHLLNFLLLSFILWSSKKHCVIYALSHSQSSSAYYIVNCFLCLIIMGQMKYKAAKSVDHLLLKSYLKRLCELSGLLVDYSLCLLM